MQPFSPQIEIAVFQANVLGILLLAKYWQWQFLRHRLHDHIGGADFDLPRRQAPINGISGPRDNDSGNGQHTFNPHAV